MSDDKTININSFYQSGGITAHTVNMGVQPRHINDAIKSDLVNKLSVHKEKDISVTSSLGDGEAAVFAHEIGEYLKSKGYKVHSGNQAVWSRPVLGQGIEFPGDGTVSILIGSNNG